jgi:DeoR family transcriptional regulator, suf operon transcriptional repressor
MRPEGTPRTILTLLREGPRQAQDLAAALGIDASAARRHLEDLRAAGLVDAEDVVAGPGRPKKMYRLTAQGQEAFPRDYALLLGLLVAKVREARGEKDLRDLMARIAKDLAAPLAAKASGKERLAALLALYNELGFEASLDRAPGGHVLTQRNCIVLRTARDDPALLCECFDEGVMRAALPGAKVEFLGSLATGARVCRHRIAL